MTTRNGFWVLDDEVEDSPSLILIGNSFIRHQDLEFCGKGRKRLVKRYPGSGIEDIAEKVDGLVVDSSERSVLVCMVVTNNVKGGKSEDILQKYKVLLEKLRNSRKR